MCWLIFAMPWLRVLSLHVCSYIVYRILSIYLFVQNCRPEGSGSWVGGSVGLWGVGVVRGLGASGGLAGLGLEGSLRVWGQFAFGYSAFRSSRSRWTHFAFTSAKLLFRGCFGSEATSRRFMFSRWIRSPGSQESQECGVFRPAPPRNSRMLHLTGECCI